MIVIVVVDQLENKLSNHSEASIHLHLITH